MTVVVSYYVGSAETYGFHEVVTLKIEDEWVRSHDLCAPQGVCNECDLQTISPIRSHRRGGREMATSSCKLLVKQVPI
jgi:hypothetical protein